MDREFLATKRLRGPLHGVPISLKDQFDMQGFDSTIGFTQYVYSCTALSFTKLTTRAGGPINLESLTRDLWKYFAQQVLFHS